MTSAIKSNEPVLIANTLSILGVFMPAPQTVVIALVFDAYACTRLGRPRLRHSVAVGSLALDLPFPYPSRVPLYPDRWTSRPTSVPAKLCLLSGRRGLPAWRVLWKPPTGQEPSWCSVGVLPHPARTEQR